MENGQEKNLNEMLEEVEKRFKDWRGMPSPWEALGGTTLAEKRKEGGSTTKMNFTIEEAEYVFERLDPIYRLEFIFYLLLDDSFAKYHLEWIKAKMSVLDKEFVRLEKGIIFLQIKNRMKKTEGKLYNHG